jgi:hypothetical protein
VKNYPQKWPDWKVGNWKLYYLYLDQVGKSIDETTDRWKLVVPAEDTEQVLTENHYRPMAGHLGIAKTFLNIAQLYY